jgi:hypothetical protein
MIRRWALNRADLILGLLSLAVLTSLLCTLVIAGNERFLPKDPESRKALITALVAGWVAISLAALGGAIKITAARQSLISVISSEIKAIQYGLARMDMFKFWTVVFSDPEKGAIGFADVPREERYFELFHSVSQNIGNLHPRVAESIVRFYTYFKMSRDAAAALKSWKEQTDPKIRQLHVMYVVNLLGLSMLWGFVALWFMGFRANKQDRDFLMDLKTAYVAVIGENKYEELWREHIRRDALEQFFKEFPADAHSGSQFLSSTALDNREPSSESDDVRNVSQCAGETGKE